jgi:hypothetical protein
MGTSTRVRGSRPSVRSAPPGARYTSYHSERQRDPPITSANAPAPSPTNLLALARQRSSVSASACVRAAGDPEARTGAKAMYGGDEASSSVVSSELAVMGMSHASGRPLALRQALSAWRAATTGGRRRPRGGRDFGVRRKGTRGSGER